MARPDKNGMMNFTHIGQSYYNLENGINYTLVYSTRFPDSKKKPKKVSDIK